MKKKRYDAQMTLNFEPANTWYTSSTRGFSCLYQRKSPVYAVLFFLCFFLFSPVFLSANDSATPMTPEQTQAFLQKLAEMRQKNPCHQSNFTESRQLPMLQDPIVSKGTIEFCQPDHFRRTIVPPNPSVTVSDGSTLWLYYPDFSRAEKFQIPAGKKKRVNNPVGLLLAALEMRNLDQYFQIQAKQGKNETILLLTPKRAAQRKFLKMFTLVINSNFFLTSTTIELQDGETITSTYSNTKTMQFPANHFQFTPPAGTEVISLSLP